MKTAVVLVVKNEEFDIAEWIAYHSQIGFDNLIIFDDLSTDKTFRLLFAARDVCNIRLHQGTFGARVNFQTDTYSWVCKQYGDEFDWLLFIDADEYLILHDADRDIKKFLRRFDGWSGVAVNWAVFGSNGHIRRPPGLVTESFTRRADITFFPSRHVKSFVRPKKVISVPNSHYFELLPSSMGTYCDPSGEPVDWFLEGSPPRPYYGLIKNPPSYKVCQLNHYFVRSREHWEARLKRGSPGIIRNEDDFKEHDRNEVEDTSAFFCIDRVRMMKSYIVKQSLSGAEAGYLSASWHSA